MHESERLLLEDYINNILRKKHADLVAHLDIIENMAILTCFWNRISEILYADAHSFRFSARNVESVLESEVRSYFEI